MAQTRKNRTKRRCTRTVVAGTLSFAAHGGTNKVRFDGRLSRHHRLAPATYTLLVGASAAGGKSPSRSLRFTIVR